MISGGANYGLTTAPMDALTNSSELIKPLKDRGFSDSEIAKLMSKASLRELPMDILSNMIQGNVIFGKGMGLLGKTWKGRLGYGSLNIPLEMGTEYVQEGNQEANIRKFLGMPYTENPIKNFINSGQFFNYPEEQRAANFGAVGSILPSAGGTLKHTIFGKDIPPQPEPNKNTNQAGMTFETLSKYANPWVGKQMDNGNVGCVEAATKIGSGYNDFLREELKRGVAGVAQLRDDAKAKGLLVPYDENNLQAGDVLGWKDDSHSHVVIYDGKGGYFGNNSSRNQIVHSENPHSYGKPDWVIKTGVAENNKQPKTKTANNENFVDWVYNTPIYGNNDFVQKGKDATINKIVSEAQRQGVDPKLALTIGMIESHLNQSEGSGAGAIGVMQLMPDTARGLGVDPYDEDQNIHGGVKFLKQMLDRFNGNVQLAVAAYNAGPGRVEKAGGVPNIAETQKYAEMVQRIYGNSSQATTSKAKQQGNSYLGENGQGENKYWIKQHGGVSYNGAQPQTLNAIDVLGKWFYDKTGKPLVVTSVTDGKSHVGGAHSHYNGWKFDINDHGSGAEGTLLGANGGKGTLTNEFIKFGRSLGLGMNWEGDHIDVAVDGTQWDGNGGHAGGFNPSNAQTTKQGKGKKISGADDPNFSAVENKMWRLAQRAAKRAKEKYDLELSPELIYRQWYHETGGFTSRLFKEVNNLGGLKTNGVKTNSPAPDGGYYKEFNSLEDSTDSYVDGYIKYRPELNGIKTIEDWAEVMRNTDYYMETGGKTREQAVQGYIAGMKGAKIPNSEGYEESDDEEETDSDTSAETPSEERDDSLDKMISDLINKEDKPLFNLEEDSEVSKNVFQNFVEDKLENGTSEDISKYGELLQSFYKNGELQNTKENRQKLAEAVGGDTLQNIGQEKLNGKIDEYRKFMSTQINPLQKEVEELEAKHKKARETFDAYKANKTDFDTDVSKAYQQQIIDSKKALEEKLSQLETATVHSRPHRIDSLQKEISELERRKEARQKDLEAVTKERADIEETKTRQPDWQPSEGTLSKLNRLESLTQRQIDSLQRALDLRTADLEKAKTYTARQYRIDNLEKEISALESQKAQAEKNRARVNRIEGDLQYLEPTDRHLKQLESIQRKIDSRTAKLETLRAETPPQIDRTASETEAVEKFTATLNEGAKSKKSDKHLLKLLEQGDEIKFNPLAKNSVSAGIVEEFAKDKRENDTQEEKKFFKPMFEEGKFQRKVANIGRTAGRFGNELLEFGQKKAVRLKNAVKFFKTLRRKF